MTTPAFGSATVLAAPAPETGVLQATPIAARRSSTPGNLVRPFVKP